MASANAEEGPHTHGDEPVRQLVVAPRAELRLGDQELVLAYLSGRVIVFLQKYVDGTPTSGAAVQLTIDFIPADLKEIAAGVYGSDPWPLAGGSNDVEVSLTIGGRKESATIPLVIPNAGGATTAKSADFVSVGAVPRFALVIAALVVFLGVNGLLLRRRISMARATPASS
jgi:hypothetical protein